jgi:hypothetical protein
MTQTTDSTKRQAYPLEWPPAKQRTAHRKTNQSFKTGFAPARDECLREIHRLGGSEPIISTNIPLKKGTNIPYSMDWGKTIPDPGVAVYFKRKGKELCFACDCWNHVQDNMHAITLTIEALRGISRWGTGDMMEAAFRGFTALPESTGGLTWWKVLGTAHNATEEQINDAYKDLARKYHPNNAGGGNAEKWMEIRQAYDQAQALFRRET